MLMISHKGVGEGSHSYQDTRSEVGVTSVITPLPLGEGKGEGPYLASLFLPTSARRVK